MAFAAAVRVVNWVHNFSADTWAPAHMAAAAGFAYSYIHPVGVSELADSGQTGNGKGGSGESKVERGEGRTEKIATCLY